MIITIFYSVYTYIEGKKKMLKYAYIIGVGLLIIRYGAILGSYTFLEPTYYTKYDYVLREDMDSKELGDFFTENQEKFKGQVVTSMYFSPRQYSLNYHANTYRYPYDEKYLNDYIMETCHWFLVGWLVFDLLVFIWAWWDNLYYSHDMKNKFKRLKETLTEE